MAAETAKQPDVSDGILPFFVYGTLMTGYKNCKAVVKERDVARKPGFIVQGKLFHLEGFPGVQIPSTLSDNTSAPIQVTAAHAAVTGEVVWGPADPEKYAALLHDLDALEEFYGFEDPRNVYDRRRVTAYYTTETGEIHEVTAWMYTYMLSTDGYTWIPDGDWRNYMLREGKEDKADDWKEAVGRFCDGKMQQQEEICSTIPESVGIEEIVIVKRVEEVDVGAVSGAGAIA